MNRRRWSLWLGLALLSACAEHQTRPNPGSNTTNAPDSNNLVAVQQQAVEAYAKQDWATSEQHYVVLTQKVPTDVEPWFKLGNIYARTQRLDLAVRA
jgi:Flp pilus assembly protein TadD